MTERSWYLGFPPGSPIEQLQERIEQTYQFEDALAERDRFEEFTGAGDGGMNTQETERAIRVMQAYLGGAKIQCRSKEPPEEWKILTLPGWDWTYFDYRVTPRHGDQWLLLDVAGCIVDAWIDRQAAMEAFRAYDQRDYRLVRVKEVETITEDNA